jgi:hypothetical protein
MICAITFLLDNIYAHFGYKMCCQIDRIPLRRNCAPLIADLFLLQLWISFIAKRLQQDIQSWDRKYFQRIW